MNQNATNSEKDNLFESSDGRVVEYSNIIVCPYTRDPNYGNVFCGGPCFPQSAPSWVRHVRGKSFYDNSLKIDFFDATQKMSGNYLFGGALVGHFGHQIAEFSHRLWPAFEKKFTVLFAASDGVTEIPKYLQDLLVFFNIPDWKVITNPTIVENLLFAESGKFLNQLSKKWYLDKLDNYYSNKSDIKDELFPKDICVLRPHIQTGRILGEKWLEAILEKNGFFPLRPEDFNFIDQIKFYLNANNIIFSEGSALHMLDILPRINAKVISIARRPGSFLAKNTLDGKVERHFVYEKIKKINSLTSKGGNDLSVVDFSDFFYHTERFLQKKVKKIDYLSMTDVIFDVEDYSSFHGGGNPFFQFEMISSFLESNQKGEKDLTGHNPIFTIFDIARKNGLKSALCIGKLDEKFIRRLPDWNIKWDDSEYQIKICTSENTFNQANSSDQSELTQEYDMIYLHNQTNVAQILDLFLKIYAKTNDGVITIIPNTLPFDYFSTIEDPELAMKSRKAFGGRVKKHWCGDAYKFIFFLAKYLPHLNFGTCVNGQFSYTLVWGSGKDNTDFKLINSSNVFEYLNSINYYETLVNKKIFRIMHIQSILFNYKKQNKVKF